MVSLGPAGRAARFGIFVFILASKLAVQRPKNPKNGPSGPKGGCVTISAGFCATPAGPTSLKSRRKMQAGNI